MSDCKNKALRYAETSGIIEYKVAGNEMHYIVSYPEEMTSIYYIVNLDSVTYTEVTKHDLTFGDYTIERIKSADVEQRTLDKYFRPYEDETNGIVANLAD